MYDFFEDITGTHLANVAQYATNLFIIFALLNVSGIIVDAFAPAIFGIPESA